MVSAEIIFIPRIISMWRQEKYDNIRLTRGNISYIPFINEKYFIDWLKSETTVRFDDLNYPVTISEWQDFNGVLRKSVVQWTCVGWIQEDIL
jgi:hypothetical protein